MNDLPTKNAIEIRARTTIRIFSMKLLVLLEMVMGMKSYLCSEKKNIFGFHLNHFVCFRPVAKEWTKCYTNFRLSSPTELKIFENSFDISFDFYFRNVLATGLYNVRDRCYAKRCSVSFFCLNNVNELVH